MHPLRVAGLRHRAAVAILGGMLGVLALGGPVLARPIDVDDPTITTAAVPRIVLKLRASGLSKPVFATSARDGTGRIFILEQTGKIKIYKGGAILSTPFLSLVGKVGTAFEQGLLGLAFHPGFKTNRKLYVSYTNLNDSIVVREYRTYASNPNRVNTATARTIIKIAKPATNHNGGMLAFASGGYLFISTGDGGGSGDLGNRAQSLDSLLGKMLRININGTTSTKNYRIPASNPYVGKPGRDEIWQTGLRNPWRWSFDRANGNMWIGDVGQVMWEEVDRAIRTSSGPGKGINWGWRVLEGTHCYNPANDCDTSGKTMPLLEYEHVGGRCSVIGGYVYRGKKIPALVGQYVYGDFCTGEIWAVASGATAPATPVLLRDTSLTISSFGENASGELLVLDRGGGKMYVIVRG
ncbi:MAG TPA: PQQ-dependent sugar dehydrogenase [Candidatus Limnocylindria bacterium]|nr:PQQ-dependent sugar dehydrogenase [Candidatus Limnocylindria bacterium]